MSKMGWEALTPGVPTIALCVAVTAGMIDVKNKHCESLTCMKRGLFGYEGQKARFCGSHRMTGWLSCRASCLLTAIFACFTCLNLLIKGVHTSSKASTR